VVGSGLIKPSNTPIRNCSANGAGTPGCARCIGFRHGRRGSSAAESSASPGPILWRARFPKEIAKSLVSFENPKGQVTNSDLELAASVVHHDIAAHNFAISERTISSGSDNTPTVSWQTKGSTTTTSAPAYLLRLQALHQRYHRYQTSAFFIPGRLNLMADNCSRLCHLTDAQLLAHFNSTYPQTHSWRIVQPRSARLCAASRAGIVPS
jgi:hypothetical protein